LGWIKVVNAVLIILLTLASGTATIVALLFVLGIFTRGTSPIIRAMVADSMHEKVSFHDAFSAYSFASRGSSALCRPIYGYLTTTHFGIAAVFYASSAMSLLTLYPAAKYRGSGEALVPASLSSQEMEELEEAE
jgi:MFS family permease